MEVVPFTYYSASTISLSSTEYTNRVMWGEKKADVSF